MLRTAMTGIIFFMLLFFVEVKIAGTPTAFKLNRAGRKSFFAEFANGDAIKKMLRENLRRKWNRVELRAKIAESWIGAVVT